MLGFVLFLWLKMFNLLVTVKISPHLLKFVLFYSHLLLDSVLNCTIILILVFSRNHASCSALVCYYSNGFTLNLFLCICGFENFYCLSNWIDLSASMASEVKTLIKMPFLSTNSNLYYLVWHYVSFFYSYSSLLLPLKDIELNWLRLLCLWVAYY